MSISLEEVLKVAHLARLSINEKEQELYTHQLSQILKFVDQMSAVDTSNIAPMSYPDDEAQQPLRTDSITERNQRQILQRLAPSVQAGLYIVPKVIE